MARRKARIPEGKKLQPAVKDLYFNLTNAGIGVQTDHYVSLSQVASIVNRRFYRAGLNWAVAGFEFITPGPYTGEITISKIPDTWIASNAWHKGFANWQRLNDEASDEVPSVKAKFTDFKVYMDADHAAAGVAANLLPSNGATAVPGEWVMSKQVVPKTDGTDGVNNFEIIWTGANYPGAGASGLNSVSLIEGYAASRGLPDVRDPNVPTDAADADGATPENWMSATFNEGTTQDDRVISDLAFENNQSPYPFENDGTHTDTMYPGGANQLPGLQIYDNVKMTNSTVGAKAYVPGTNFQGGLIKISTIPRQYSLPNGELTSAFGTVAMVIRLVPGSHRGYMCQKMQDV